MDAKTLETAIHNGIPLSQSAGFQILQLDKHAIRVSGSAEENINVHGTAFAGSLYMLCTLASWGLVYAHLPKEAALVIAEAKIQYLAPVKGDIIAEAEVDPTKMDNFLSQLGQCSKAKLQIKATVDHLSKRAVEYTASLHTRLT